MEKKIFTIGYTIPTLGKDYIDFYDESSLMDADILLISPDSLRPTGDWVSFTAGDGGCYNVGPSEKFKKQTSRLKKEMEDHLISGKNVFIFLTKKEEYKLASSVSSGRKNQYTYSTETSSNYNFLPINIGVLTSASGKHVEFSGNQIFNDFYERFKKYLEYQLYVENPGKAQIIFTGKDKTKVLGAIYRVHNGHIVVLPYLQYNENEFIKYKAKEKKSYWTADAVKFGKTLIKTFIDIDKALSAGGDKTPPPDWVGEVVFQLDQERALGEEVEAKSKEIDQLILQKNDLLAKIDQEAMLRDLLFEKGKTLENAIGFALKILGYEAENYNDGNLELDHVIISPEGERFIGEAEGKDNSAINIDKFRQLATNIQEDLQREEVKNPAYGILFGNGFRLAEPSERAEQFTAKCINTAKSLNCILMRTMDLFEIAKYVKESKDETFAKECRDTIKSSMGGIVQFPNIPAARDASLS